MAFVNSSAESNLSSSHSGISLSISTVTSRGKMLHRGIMSQLLTMVVQNEEQARAFFKSKMGGDANAKTRKRPTSFTREGIRDRKNTPSIAADAAPRECPH